MTGVTTYRSLVNGIEFDVPSDEVTIDFLNSRRSQDFVAPVEGIGEVRGKVTEAGVPRKSAKKAAVELE